MNNKDFAAVVGTTDNGGSTGKIREEFGIPAVGDFRRVVNYLSTGSLSTVMESRYQGHALGNLALLDIIKRLGFKKALDKYRKAMGVSQKIVPQFLDSCDLVATISGKKVFGEYQIDDCKGKVEKIWLEPTLELNHEVLEMLDSADTLILGPGSLYTSILPHLVPAGLASRLSKIPLKVYVMAITNDLPIVHDFKVSHYVNEVENFVKLDHIVVQNPDRGVSIDVHGERFLLDDVAHDNHIHNPKKLGDALCRLLK